MTRIMLVCACLFSFALYSLPALSQVPSKVELNDMEPKEEISEYEHVLALGVNQPFSKGYNKYSPLFMYAWFGDNYKNKDLFTQFTMTTTRIFFILAMKTDKIFTGIKPQLEHSTYSGWRSYNRGYNDTRREFGGNNFGPHVFFQYSWLRILTTKVYFNSTYHFYRFPLLTENEHKVVNMPKRHWQLKPGIEVLLSDVKETNLTRVKHGYLIRGEYQYARRIGYGTWYDYDRLYFREKNWNAWIPPAVAPGWGTEGVTYKSKVHETHRVYFNVGGYYKFAHEINLLFDFYGGYFKGVDRNNAEQIGYMQADHAIMPGYAAAEFYHHFYLISRLQLGLPLFFWDARIQPGFNVLYMPKTNNVVG